MLWAAAAETGRRAHAGMFGIEGGPDGVASRNSAAIRWHVIRTALLVLLVADMIYKPGA